MGDKVYLKDILTVSQSLMYVVSPTDEMFGHPLATLTVANEHLDAIRETPFTCSVLCLSFTLPQTFHSVSDCLAYFSSHGLEELSNTQTDEDVHRLPRITPVDLIVSQS